MKKNTTHQYCSTSFVCVRVCVVAGKLPDPKICLSHQQTDPTPLLAEQDRPDSTKESLTVFVCVSLSLFVRMRVISDVVFRLID